MFEFIASFIFEGTKDHVLSDAIVYNLRREVSRMLEQSDFGDSIENHDKGFDNSFAVPAIDEFIANRDELRISYMWLFPLTSPGDLWHLQSVSVPELHAFAENLNIKFTFRTHLI